MRPGLVQRRMVWLPTWKGWAVLAAIGFLAAGLVLGGLYPFLAVTRPVTADLLVVEGWVPDEVLEEAAREYRRGAYRFVAVTGVPIESGRLSLPFDNHADMGAAGLRNLGLDAATVRAVPAVETRKDRTYQSALALRQWLKKDPTPVRALNVVTHSCHARRTWLLFRAAFGDEIPIGILACDTPKYDASNWWRRGAGVRDTVGESLAYLYARWLFRPPKP